MDSFTYVNIFETKGLEYLLVISFLFGFLLLVRFLTPPERSTIGETPICSRSKREVMAGGSSIAPQPVQ